ncbi:copper-binding protein [soil metagenome]
MPDTSNARALVSRCLLAAMALIGASAATVVHAQAEPGAGSDHAAHQAMQPAPVTQGEIRKIDKEQGKLTLRHGPIANLDMPGMTMVFKVADPKMLEDLREGDKVKFAAERVNGAITVTAIEPAR